MGGGGGFFLLDGHGGTYFRDVLIETHDSDSLFLLLVAMNHI